MAFTVTTLHNVPDAQGLLYYMYVLDFSGAGLYEAWFHKNFGSIGHLLGGRAAIVQGYDDQLTREVFEFLHRYVKDKEQLEAVERIIHSGISLLVSKGHLSKTNAPVYIGL
jgi:hypothetical protein